jgi:hypothetical protein
MRVSLPCISGPGRSPRTLRRLLSSVRLDIHDHVEIALRPRFASSDRAEQASPVTPRALVSSACALKMAMASFLVMPSVFPTGSVCGHPASAALLDHLLGGLLGGGGGGATGKLGGIRPLPGFGIVGDLGGMRPFWRSDVTIRLGIEGFSLMSVFLGIDAG